MNYFAFATVALLAAAVYAQDGYVFSDGYLEILGNEPDRSFTCENRPYGYYADIPSDCRIFHICVPLEDDVGEIIQTQHYSFFCGNATVFSQDSLTCSHPEDAFPCSEAEGYYDQVNSLFGQKDAQLNQEGSNVNVDYAEY